MMKKYPNYLAAIFTVAVLSVSAFAGTYLNFHNDGAGSIYISQNSSACDFGSFGEKGDCHSVLLSDISQTAQVLDSLFAAFWHSDTDVSDEVSLNFASDLDFGEIDATGSCFVNHTPLTFWSSTGKIEGNGFALKNVCFEKSIPLDGSYNGVLDSVGIFKMLDSVSVSNLVIDNLRFSLTGVGSGATEVGSNFVAAGALASSMKRSKVTGIVIRNVSINAPMAGGLVGYAENSSITDVSTEESLTVTNNVEIPEGSLCGGVKSMGHCGRFRVFLGGVVGAGLNLNFSGVNVTLNLENFATADASLGGLVGFYEVASSVDNSGLPYLSINASSVKANSAIRGGKCMGGLIGEASRLRYEAAYAHKVRISQSSFEGIIGNSLGDSLIVGGFVGRSFLDAGASLKIEKGYSKAEIGEALDRESTYGIFAGGFVGYASGIADAVGGNFFSIVDSKSEGSIAYSRSEQIQNSAQLRSTVFMGGLLGFGAMAYDSAMFADTSSMNLTVNLNGAKGSDSIMVGGLAGEAMLRGYSNAVMMVANSVFTGSISVADSLNKVYMGGLIGLSPNAYDGFRSEFYNSRVVADTLLKLDGGSNARIGGICGYCIKPLVLDFTAVAGHIVVNGSYDSVDSLLVGGFFGQARIGSDYSFEMKNAYFVGDISMSEKTATRKKTKAGYVAGEFYLGYSTEQSRSILSTYHFGLDSLLPIGKLDNENDPANWDDLLGKFVDARYNVRNGSSDSLTDAKNGMATESFMKSDEFVSLLNAPWSTAVWHLSDGENSGFPVFENGEVPVYSSSSAAVESSSSLQSSSSVQSSSDAVESSSAASSSSTDVNENFVVASGSWNMVSLAGLDAKSVNYAGNDGLYRWDEARAMGDYWQYVLYTENDRGDGACGYWYWSDSQLEFVPDAKAYKAGDSFVWNVDSVYSGWNLVANPFGWYVDLSDFENLEMWRWNSQSSEYEMTHVLGPYEGAWVKASRPETIAVDAKPMTDTASRSLSKRILAKVSEAGGWALRAVLSDDFGKQDSWNFLGTSSVAEESEEPPTGMSDHVSLSIVDNNRYLAKSIKADASELEWNLEVKASSVRSGYLKFEGIENVNAQGKKVYVTVDGKTVEMKPDAVLDISLKKSSKFIKVSVSANEGVAVASTLKGLKLVRLGGRIQVSFDASLAVAGNTTQVELLDVSGSVAASVNVTAAEGLNSVELSTPKRGIYVLRVSSGKEIALQKVLVR